MEAVLSRMRDAQERLSWVVEQARLRPGLAPEERIPVHEVTGCASRLWLVVATDAGGCRFRSDSESAILKALTGLICGLYEGLPPAEVIRQEPAVLGRVGLLGQLTENRRRTLARFREAMVAGVVIAS